MDASVKIDLVQVLSSKRWFIRVTFLDVPGLDDLWSEQSWASEAEADEARKAWMEEHCMNIHQVH